jgi:hypothetical protein
MTFDPSDVIFALFLLVLVWLAARIDDDWGGGKRARIPAGA